MPGGTAVLQGAGGVLDVRPRTGAGVHQFELFQLFQRGGVFGQSVRLLNHLAVPIQAEPAEVFSQLLGRTGLVPPHVDVFDAKGDPPAAVAGAQPGDEISAGVADVLCPGG